MDDEDRMTVYYDGACPICTAAADGWSRDAERSGVVLMPLQAAAPEQEAPAQSELLKEIHVRSGHEWLRGARALRAVYRRLGNRPMTALLSAGIALGLADPVYRMIARNRQHLRLPLRRRRG